MTENPPPAPFHPGDDPTQRLLGFEVLLADFSAAFVAAFPSDLDGLMTRWLLRVVEFLDLDRSSVGRFRPDGSLELAHFAALPGIEPTTAAGTGWASLASPGSVIPVRGRPRSSIDSGSSAT